MPEFPNWAQVICNHGAIFVLHEKYGRRYFLADSIDELSKICLMVLRERHGVCWSKDPGPPPVAPEISRAEIGQLRGREKAKALRKIRIYEEGCMMYERMVVFLRAVEEAINGNGNGPLALSCLRFREDYEYEYTELVPLHKVD